MKIKKFASGGAQSFASFTIINLPLPAYSGIGSINLQEYKEKDKDKEKDGSIGLLTKDIQKLLAENGLPSDVLYFLSTVDVFGNGIDPLIPGSELKIYLKMLSMLPEIKLNKAEYDDAIRHAREKGTLDLVAVNSSGQVYVRTANGDIKLKNPFDISKTDERLTNGLLAQLRAYLKPMDKGEYANVIASSINIHDIEESIGKILSKIGKTTTNIESYVTKDAQAKKLADGYQKLIEQGPDGVYKISEKKVTLDSSVKALLNYIYASLSNQEKSVLANRAIDSGLKGKDGILLMLTLLIQGRLEEEHDIKVDYDSSASSANGYKNGKGKSGSGDIDMNDVDSTPASRFFAGLGDFKQHMFRQSDGTGAYITYGNETIITRDGGLPMGDLLLLSELSLSDLNGGLDLTQVSFGGIPILSSDTNKILLNGNKVVSADLPYEEIDGRIIPDIDKMNIISQILEQNKELIEQGKYQEVNAIFLLNGLKPYFNSNGKTTGFYKRFAVILAYADEELVTNGSLKYQIFGEYSDVDDYELGDIVAQLKSRNKKEGIKYTPSRPSFLGVTLPFTSENIVKSMIFIPINSNAVTWFQGKMKAGEAQLLDAASQQRQAQLDVINSYKPTQNPF